MSWYYTWRPSTADSWFSAPAGMEFVPMIWSAKEVTSTYLAQAKAEPSPVLLGFNEPDNKDQANMSVDTAISLWPQLQATGKRLGSPATSSQDFPYQPGSWMDQFMTKAAANNLKIDFLAVHYYAENSARWDTATAVADMKTFLDAMYAKYKKPIWVTEWALTDWWPITYPSFDVQASFAKAASQMMDSLPYVERYAFFALPSYTSGSTSYLYNADGSPTPTGVAYKSV